MTRPCSQSPDSPRRRTFGRWFVALGVLAVAVLGTAQPAAAHDQLLESTPAADSTTQTPPTEITLLFSNDLLDLSTQVLVNDAGGAVVLDTEGVTEGTQVTATFEDELGAGAYTVAWRVVSSDGHPIQGSFAFAVAGSSTPPTTPAADDSAAPAATPSPAATASTASDSTATAGTRWTPVWVGLGGAALVAGVVVVLRRRSHPPTP